MKKILLPFLLVLSTAASAAPKKAPAPENKLRTLLLSSAWCSFSYNKISGASSTKRVSFRKNGTWSAGGRAESYSSGANGSVAGQRDSAANGRWAVQGDRLLMSNPPETPELTDVGLTGTLNSSGYPILKVDGVEYSQCK